jgi:colanic acid/amylovoran biosynthesis glycosyltransferase
LIDHVCEEPRILIFTDLLLTPSMTFIMTQGEALKNFAPYYLGSRAVCSQGLLLPGDRTLILNRTGTRWGKLKEIPFKVFGFDPVLFRHARKLNPVLIHAHFGPAGFTAMPLSKWLGIPLIVTFHGYDATVNESQARRSTYTHRRYIRKKKALQEYGHLFIAVSDFIRGKLLDQGFPDKRVIRIYIGVDTKFFFPDHSVSREPIVLFVGNLVENKGCNFAILAMAQVQQLRPDVEFVIIGDGPLRSELETLARKRLRRYRFLGYQQPGVVRNWMNRARVFCVPSVEVSTGASEGFGMVFAEAQSMGVPVASFETGGISEAVLHSKTGLLSPPRDYDQLAINIHRLLTDPQMWYRMSSAARERVCAHFDLRSQTSLLEDVYAEVLEQSLVRSGRVVDAHSVAS